jgi:hypothetical protein
MTIYHWWLFLIFIARDRHKQRGTLVSSTEIINKISNIVAIQVHILTDHLSLPTDYI